MGAGTPGCDAGPGRSTIAPKMFPARPRYADVKPAIRPIDRWRSVRCSSRQTSPIATRIRHVKNAVRCAASQARGCGRMAVAIPSQTPMKRKMKPWRSNRRRCDSIKLVMVVSHCQGDSSADAPGDADSTVEALQLLEHSADRENQAAE